MERSISLEMGSSKYSGRQQSFQEFPPDKRLVKFFSKGPDIQDDI